MTMQLDERATIKPETEPDPFVELRGSSGRLYGRIDLKRMLLEVKRKGEPPEVIDLKALQVRV